MKMYDSPNSSCSRSSRLITWAWIDTSSADTGSSQTMISGLERQRAGDADALPLTAGELVRVAVDVVGVEPDERRAAPAPRRRRSPRGTTSGWISNGSPTMSPTVIRGFSEVYGSCMTIWMFRRTRAQLAAPRSLVRCPCPRTVIEPAVGVSSPTSSLASVDLPQPDSPTTPSVSPRRSSKSTPSTA